MDAPKVTDYRQVLSQMGGMVTYTVGVSMLPLIRQGKNYVAVVPPDNPQIGDIILFEEMRHGKKCNILHRLIEIEHPTANPEDDVYVTRGDNCLNCERMHLRNIIGKVSEIYSNDRLGLTRILLGKRISVTDKAYLRYVRFWAWIWPLRRAYYRQRVRLSRIPWLRKLYHRIK